MSADRCEPPAGTETGTLHILSDPDGRWNLACWHGGEHSEWITTHDNTIRRGEYSYLGGWRYVSAVPSPAAVAALVRVCQRIIVVRGKPLVGIEATTILDDLETSLSAFPQPKDTDNAV